MKGKGLLASVCPATLAGCVPASGAPRDMAAESVCSPYTGFLSVGTVWEYALRNTLFEGWERSELISLDAATGAAELRIAGGHATDGFTYSFDRAETFVCNAAGLTQTGWTSAWELTNEPGDFDVTGTLSSTWRDPPLLLPPDPLVGDTWHWNGTFWCDTFRMVTGEGTNVVNCWAYDFTIDPEEDLDLLGTTITALPVVDLYSGQTTWYAEDYGIVARDGLALESFTLGTGLADPEPHP